MGTQRLTRAMCFMSITRDLSDLFFIQTPNLSVVVSLLVSLRRHRNFRYDIRGLLGDEVVPVYEQNFGQIINLQGLSIELSRKKVLARPEPPHEPLKSS